MFNGLIDTYKRSASLSNDEILEFAETINLLTI